MDIASLPPTKRILGLTGSMGSGKSFVASLMRRASVPVVCADDLSREVTQAGSPELEIILKSFGPAVVAADGSLDRKALAGIIFRDAEKKKLLEGIIHPAVRARILHFIEKNSQEPLIVCDVPLLYEANFDVLCTFTVVVSVDETVRQQRLQRDRGMTIAEINARLDQQLPQDEKIRRATFVINNSGTPQQTCEQVNALLARLFEGTSKTPSLIPCQSISL